jgi:hypothetical protein
MALRSLARRIAWVLLLAGILLVLPCSRSSATPPDAQKNQVVKGPKLEVTVSASSLAFRGLPFLVEMKFRNLSGPIDAELIAKIESTEERERAMKQYLIQQGLPQSEFFSAYPAVGVRIRTIEGNELKQPEPPGRSAYWEMDPAIAPGPSRPSVGAPKNAWRGLVIDLGPWTSELAPGKYHVSLLAHPWHGKDAWESKPVQVEVKDLSAEAQRKVRGKRIPFKLEDRKYSSHAWLDAHLDVAVLKETLPPEAFAATGLHRFVGSVVRAQDPARGDIAILDDVPPPLRSTAAWLKYEVAKAKGDGAAAKAIRESVAKEHPEVLWRLDNADGGYGLLPRIARGGLPQ